MELLFTPEERYNHLQRNWGKELALEGFYLIQRFEYSPNKFQFLIEFFNPEKSNSKCICLFAKVTSFTDIVYELEVLEESYEYDENEDPLDFLESKKGNITEYFIHTDVRELWWRTDEPPRIEKVF
jgi:hypothetical protein